VRRRVQATNLFADILENAASGNWSKPGDWYHPQTANPYAFDATYATSGTRNFWGYDRPSAGDYSIAMTAAVAIPPGSTAHLRFNHAFGFEDDPGSAYHGGVVEYSTNNGTTWTDAGPLLTDNGYTGTIAPAPSNALGGRSGFVRESNGYRSTRANLTSLAGQTVRFRFRIGTDSIIGDYGWFIDDVRIYTCAPPALPDTDGDTIADATDNCPTTANTSQANNDGDGQGDACDPDDDTDTTADADDACPAVAASTASGCPPFGNSGSTTPTSGTTTTTPTTIGGGTTAVPTLATARVRSCRLAGRGRRARVPCTLSGFAAVRGVTVRLRGRTAVNPAARPNVNGTLTIKPRRRLRRGNYRITITLRDSRGATRKLNTRTKVR
jgi:hypothetical protein